MIDKKDNADQKPQKRKWWPLFIPHMATAMALAAVTLNATLGWPLSSEVATISAMVLVAFIIWYTPFLTILAIFPRSRPYMGIGAAGLALSWASVAYVISLPLPTFINPLTTLFGAPALRIVEPFDINLRQLRRDETRCNVLEWEKLSQKEKVNRSVEWVDFLDDGRLVLLMEEIGPVRGTEHGRFYYDTLVVLKPDGSLDRGFAEKFHQCLEGDLEKPMILGNKIVFVREKTSFTDRELNNPDEKHKAVERNRVIGISEIIDADGTRATPEAIERYTKELREFESQSSYAVARMIYGPTGKRLLAVIADRDGYNQTSPDVKAEYGVFDFKDDAWRLSMRFKLDTGVKVDEGQVLHENRLTLGYSEEETRKWHEPKKPNPANGLREYYADGFKPRTMIIDALPPELNLPGIKIEYASPLAAVGADTLTEFSYVTTNGRAYMPVLVSPEGKIRPDLLIVSPFNLSNPRPMRDGRVALVGGISRYGVFFIPPLGRAVLLDPNKLALPENAYKFTKTGDVEQIWNIKKGGYPRTNFEGFTIVGKKNGWVISQSDGSPTDFAIPPWLK